MLLELLFEIMYFGFSLLLIAFNVVKNSNNRNGGRISENCIILAMDNDLLYDIYMNCYYKASALIGDVILVLVL